jgi:hypothetical protein
VPIRERKWIKNGVGIGLGLGLGLGLFVLLVVVLLLIFWSKGWFKANRRSVKPVDDDGYTDQVNSRSFITSQLFN